MILRASSKSIREDVFKWLQLNLQFFFMTLVLVTGHLEKACGLVDCLQDNGTLSPTGGVSL